jgi:hypothetical protein
MFAYYIHIICVHFIDIVFFNIHSKQFAGEQPQEELQQQMGMEFDEPASGLLEILNFKL